MFKLRYSIKPWCFTSLITNGSFSVPSRMSKGI